MTSADFVRHFRNTMIIDLYEDIGELESPVGLYAIRRYPSHMKLPEEYYCVIHVGHYDGDMFQSIDYQMREEYRNLDIFEKREISAKLPRTRPMNLRQSDEYVINQQSFEIKNKKGAIINPQTIIEEIWDLHNAPFSGWRYFPHRIRSACGKAFKQLVRVGIAIINALAWLTGFTFDVTMVLDLRRDSHPQSTRIESETVDLLGMKVPKPVLVLWALLILCGYCLRSYFPIILKGVMTKPIPSTALGVLCLLVAFFIHESIKPLGPRLAPLVEETLKSLYFRSFFWGGQIRKIWGLYI